MEELSRRMTTPVRHLNPMTIRSLYVIATHIFQMKQLNPIIYI